MAEVSSSTGPMISFSGLASGIDTRAIIDALIEVERIPILRLENRKVETASQRSFFNNLKSKLEALTSAAESLDSLNEFAAYSATTSDETVVSSSAGSGATPGTYDITVNSLARRETESSAQQASDTANVGSGTFDITVGGTVYNVDVSGSASNTLEDVANAIEATGAPVSANVISDGTGYILMVTADDAGTANTISFSNFSDPGFELGLGFSEVQAAADASMTVNGITVTRSSNSIGDVISGVTFDLHKEGDSATVTVERDAEGIKEGVQEFIDAFNDSLSYLKTQFDVDDEGNTQAVLFGDGGVRRMVSGLRTSAFGAVSSLSGSAYDSLSSIGIRQDSSGNLSLDDDDFESALGEDFEAVANVFIAASDGIAAAIVDRVDSYTDSVDGLIKYRLDGLDRREEIIDDRIEDLEARLERYEESLVSKFASFETLISNYQSQGSTLTGFFSNQQSS